MYYDVQARLKHAGLSTHIIGANGATVQLASGERLYTAGMNKSELIKGLQWMIAEHHYFALYTDEAIYVHTNGYNWVKSELDEYKRQERSYGDKVIVVPEQTNDPFFKQFDELTDVLDKDTPVFKIMAFSLDDEKRRKAASYFKDNDNFNVERSAHGNFEVMRSGVTKGVAVQLLADKLGIPIKETMTLGDNHNDITMLEAAGYGIAMGNADDRVVSSTAYQTCDYRNDGVAYAINTYLDRGIDGLNDLKHVDKPTSEQSS